MADPIIHVNDSGVLMLMTIKDNLGPVDLTTVEAIDVFFQRPDTSYFTRTGEIVNATSGLIRYVSLNGDFNQAGKWNTQVVVRFSSSNVKHSDIGSFTVESNIGP